MYTIATVIGARPQIIKAAALHRAMQSGYRAIFRSMVIHTGQHYDRNLAEASFLGLDLPEPDFYLGVGSASHARQTADMIQKTEEILKELKPDCLLVYGDTNSTLAGVIAACRSGIPVAHIEAGLRSKNYSMPEEINRIISDRLSTLLFAPTQAALNNLRQEGIQAGMQGMEQPSAFLSGDVMLDSFLHYSGIAEKRSQIITQYGLESGNFFMCTIHRESNTDNSNTLQNLMEAILLVAERYSRRVVIPLHPRTRLALSRESLAPTLRRLEANANILLLPPVSYLDMLMLEKHAGIVFTDSGGVQKEACFAGNPCIILREETEWSEIIIEQAGILTGSDPEKILAGCKRFMEDRPAISYAAFGNGEASSFIASTLHCWLEKRREQLQ